MIDINELRKLAQAATAGPWINYGRQPNAPGAPHSAVAAKTLLARVYSEAYGDVAQETANADLIAAANPAAITELLDRLEAAERDVALKERVIDALGSELNAVVNERDALRAKIEAMEKREPVGVMYVGSYYGYELPEWEFDADQGACDKLNEAYVNNPTTLKLYAIPDTKGE